MPAYSFKERFVPWVKDGSKPGTIRAFRKHPVKVGDTAHLYYGMRTRYCSKLMDPSPVIVEVQVLVITGNRRMYFLDTNWLELDERESAITAAMRKKYNAQFMSDFEKDEFAWRDGFRFSDNPKKKHGCFELMIRYWQQTDGLPFVGNYIRWGQTSKLIIQQ